MKFYFYPRAGKPAGITVSKTKKLPPGDFRVTEYTWPRASLWFIDSQNFTADEREAAYRQMGGPVAVVH